MTVYLQKMIVYLQKIVFMLKGIWERFKNKRDVRDDKVKQIRLKDELTKLADAMIKDWNKSSKIYKVETPDDFLKYKFENYDVIKLYRSSKKMTFEKSSKSTITTYTLSDELYSLFNDCFRKFVDIINHYYKSKEQYKRPEQDYRKQEQFFSGNKNKNPINESKFKLYNTLIGTIRLRRQNLPKEGDPNRASMVSELNIAIRKAKSLKDKYNF